MKQLPEYGYIRDEGKIVTIGLCYVAIAMQPMHRLQNRSLVHN